VTQTSGGLHFEIREGPAPDAPTVILSSGLGGSGAFWAPQMAALAQQCRVVLYDHRGTGKSTRGLAAPTSVQAMADDIIEVLDAAGLERAHLVGHAAGGNAGLALALSHPDRLASLTVVNGWAGPDPHIRRCFDTRLALLKDSGPEAYIHAQPLFLYPANWISQNAQRLAEEEIHHIAGFQGAANMRVRIEALLTFDIEARLADIETPTLIAASADDMLVPVLCSQHLAARLPRAELEVFPWGGHAFTVTQAEAFNARLLAFLSGQV
jgi:aminoacrylate hydrolase